MKIHYKAFKTDEELSLWQDENKDITIRQILPCPSAIECEASFSADGKGDVDTNKITMGCFIVYTNKDEF